MKETIACIKNVSETGLNDNGAYQIKNAYIFKK